jgi:hypothetical protein
VFIRANQLFKSAIIFVYMKTLILIYHSLWLTKSISGKYTSKGSPHQRRNGYHHDGHSWRHSPIKSENAGEYHQYGEWNGVGSYYQRFRVSYVLRLSRAPSQHDAHVQNDAKHFVYYDGPGDSGSEEIGYSKQSGHGRDHEFDDYKQSDQHLTIVLQKHLRADVPSYQSQITLAFGHVMASAGSR